MIRFVVRVASIEHLEILLGVAKTLDLTPDLGSEPLPLPSKRRRGRSTKRGKKTKGKRRSGHMQVKVAPMHSSAPPRVTLAREVLLEEFGTSAFKKGLATGVLMKRMKLANRPTGYVSQLLDRGGLVPA